MGLDIEALDKNDNVIAEYRISVWDYFVQMMWDKSMRYEKYGGDVSRKHISEAISILLELGDEDMQEWKEKADKTQNVIFEAIQSIIGTPMKLENSNIADDPDRIIKKYNDLKKFFITCYELNEDPIKIKVIG